MFTFLPRDYKGYVVREYRKRLVFVALGLLVPLLLSAIAFSVPTYLILSAKKTADAGVEKSKAAVTVGSAELEQSVKDIETEMQFIKDKSDEKRMLSLIESLLSKKGDAVTYTGMSFKRGSDAGGISLSGVAATRDDLVSFQKRLEGDPSFKKVVLPVSTLARGRDITFTISIDSAF